MELNYSLNKSFSISGTRNAPKAPMREQTPEHTSLLVNIYIKCKRAGWGGDGMLGGRRREREREGNRRPVFLSTRGMWTVGAGCEGVGGQESRRRRSAKALCGGRRAPAPARRKERTARAFADAPAAGGGVPPPHAGKVRRRAARTLAYAPAYGAHAGRRGRRRAGVFVGALWPPASELRSVSHAGPWIQI